MTPKQHESRRARINASMQSLIGHPAFEDYIENIRDMMDVAVEDLCRDTVVENERATAKAIGEISSYRALIAAYDQMCAVKPDTAPEE